MSVKAQLAKLDRAQQLLVDVAQTLTDHGVLYNGTKHADAIREAYRLIGEVTQKTKHIGRADLFSAAEP